MKAKSRDQPGSYQTYQQFETKSQLHSQVLAKNFFTKTNPEQQFIHMSTFNHMKRSASTNHTQRNTKFTLENLDKKISQFSTEVHNCRLEAKETFQTLKRIKSDLINDQLHKSKQQLKQKINSLDKLILHTKSQNEERKIILKIDCQKLWNNSEEIKQLLFDLRMKMQKIEDLMGFQRQNYC